MTSLVSHSVRSVVVRTLALSIVLLCATSLPLPRVEQRAGAQSADGRVLGSARGQVAWLDLLAPRPTPLTHFLLPAYPADVAATSGVPFAVASIVGAPAAASGPTGADLVAIDLAAATSHTLLARQSDAESLDLPAFWPDGSGVLYQRSNLGALIPMPGQAQPQYQSQIEQVDPDGQNLTPLLDDARYPGPAPDDAHFAFVRSTDLGATILVHSIADGLDTQLVPPGQFLALAYPRFSPDGHMVAFAAIATLAPIGRQQAAPFFSVVLSALAHGFPWEVWLVNADGSNLRQVPDVIDDDPSVAWSPDGTQLLIYGGWGSFLVDATTAATTSLPYVAGYGAVAWLPE